MPLTTGCAGGPDKKSAGDVVDDAVIGTRVKTRLLGDDRVSGLDINVDVFKGVVQLSDFVKSEAQIAVAEELAADVPGVRDVKVRLDVRGR